MITIKHHVVDCIPLLEIVPKGREEECLPTVIFYHGWTGCKEAVLVNGYELAKRGIRAILPDALYHGERQDSLPTKLHYEDFWKIVVTSIQEYTTLVSYFEKKQLTDSKQVGVSGLSMGGITTCGLFATYSSIKAADCLMGTPNMQTFAEYTVSNAENHELELPKDVVLQLSSLKRYDLSVQPEKIAGRPLHFWHGTQDQTIPYDATYDFYLRIHQLPFANKVTFTTSEDIHRVPYEITIEMADFFKKNL